MKLISSVLLPVLAAVVAICAVAQAAVEVGRPAPDFTLTDIQGKAHKLSDYQGKTVVLEWNNPDCPIVHKHYDSDNLPEMQRTFTGKGVVWLLINSGAPGLEGADYSADQVNAWLKERHSTPSAYLRDPSGKVGHLYAAKTTPHLFVINPEGVLVYDGAIDSIRSAQASDIPKAENYVKEALAALEAGKPVPKANTQPYGCSVKYAN